MAIITCVPCYVSTFDFTDQGRRPSTAQILSAWKRAGRPECFTVEYGETFAEFKRIVAGRWDDSGNGCRGVNRTAVVTALNAADGPVAPRDWLR